MTTPENEKIKSELEALIRISYQDILGTSAIDATISWWNKFLDKALNAKDAQLKTLEAARLLFSQRKAEIPVRFWMENKLIDALAQLDTLKQEPTDA